MALPTKAKRDKAVTIRITQEHFELLESLAEKHNLSQADVIEHLLDAEAQEQRRLRGKAPRYTKRS